MWYLLGFIMLVLGCIAVQDFKLRAVYWWLFLLLLAALAQAKFIQTNSQQLIHDFATNVVFLSAQLLFLTVYFSLKERRMVNVFNSYFGLGDLFFLFAICCYFSFFNYILFYLLSLFLSIVISLLLVPIVKNMSSKIPLAGIQALFLMAFLTVDYFNDKVNFTSDVYLLTYLGL